LTISCQDQKILIFFFQLLISSQFLAGQQISIPNLGNFGKLIFCSLKKAQKLDLLLRSSAPAHNLSDSLQQAIATFPFTSQKAIAVFPFTSQKRSPIKENFVTHKQ
jgi:hypothetical protein